MISLPVTLCIHKRQKARIKHVWVLQVVYFTKSPTALTGPWLPPSFGFLSWGSIWKQPFPVSPGDVGDPLQEWDLKPWDTMWDVVKGLLGDLPQDVWAWWHAEGWDIIKGRLDDPYCCLGQVEVREMLKPRVSVTSLHKSHILCNPSLCNSDIPHYIQNGRPHHDISIRVFDSSLTSISLKSTNWHLKFSAVEDDN